MSTVDTAARVPIRELIMYLDSLPQVGMTYHARTSLLAIAPTSSPPEPEPDDESLHNAIDSMLPAETFKPTAPAPGEDWLPEGMPRWDTSCATSAYDILDRDRGWRAYCETEGAEARSYIAQANQTIARLTQELARVNAQSDLITANLLETKAAARKVEAERDAVRAACTFVNDSLSLLAQNGGKLTTELFCLIQQKTFPHKTTTPTQEHRP